VRTEKINVTSVTRIEGKMNISINLDEEGNVAQAHAHVHEFRGFETFLCGHHASKVLLLTPRICGVCPVPHHLASIKALENGLGLEPPRPVAMLRELMLACEHVSDHLLHMFVLAGADLLLPDLPLAQRGLPTLYATYPEVMRQVVSMRNVTQTIISTFGVQAVHPDAAVPGGLNKRLTEAARRRFLEGVRQVKETIIKLCDELWFPQLQKAMQDYTGLGRLDTYFVTLVHDDQMALYDGTVRIIDPGGALVADFPASAYLDHIGEKNISDSYAKAAYLTSARSSGMYRAGPMARVNAARVAGTDQAGRLMEKFRSRFGQVAQETLAQHFARYISVVYAIERAEQILADRGITEWEPAAPVEYKAGEGVGIVEAPRGLLIHHFRWDDDGYIRAANIITPTNANVSAIDSSLKQVAARSIHSGQVDREKLEHEVGIMIRAYDPCISCATHALSIKEDLFGIKILDADGNLHQK
jgi:F420-non-reducing hydrogenase large subunit